MIEVSLNFEFHIGEIDGSCRLFEQIGDRDIFVVEGCDCVRVVGTNVQLGDLVSTERGRNVHCTRIVRNRAAEKDMIAGARNLAGRPVGGITPEVVAAAVGPNDVRSERKRAASERQK